MRFRPTYTIGMLAILAACSSDVGAPDAFDLPALDLVAGPPPVFCGTATVVDLVADEDVIVGSVQVVNDGQSLFVTYRTDPGVPLTKTALVVGDASMDIPTSKGGNPQPGKFPYKANHRGLPSSVTWQVEAAIITGSELHVAAFAEVQLNGETEGAWGDGVAINPDAGWATRFTHTAQSCEGPIIVEIPTSGGTIETDGLRFVVPNGSLEEATSVSVKPIEYVNPQAPWYLEGTTFEFGPTGTTFDPPAQLTLSYDPAKLPTGFPETALKGFIANGIFVLVEPTSVDVGNHQITFPVEHFSAGGVAAPTVDLAIVSFGANPDPVRIGGGGVTIDVVLQNVDALATSAADLLLTFSGAFFIIQDADMPAGCVRFGPDASGVMLVRCDAGTLAPNEAAAWQIVGTPFSGDAFKTLSIVAEALPDDASPYVDIMPSNDGRAATVDILPASAADLQMWGFGTGPVTKKAGQPVEIFTTMRSIDLGLDPVDATLRVQIDGGGTATVAIPSADLPAGCAPTITLGTATINCDLGTMNPGDEVVRTTSFVPLRTGAFTIVATVFPTTGDPNPANNTQEGPITVDPPIMDLQAILTDNVDPLDPGQLTVYTARAQNLAGSQDPLPAGSVLRIEIDGDAEIFGSPTAGCTDVTATVGYNAVNCVLPELQPGDGTNGYSVTVRPLSGPQTLIGRARFLVPDYIDDNDPDPSNNEVEETTTVNADNLVDFEVNFLTATEIGAGAAPPIQPLETVRYQARVDLNSASAPPITGGTLMFTIGGNFTVQAMPAGCTDTPFPGPASGHTIECDIGSYGAGEVKTFDVDIVPDRIQTLQATAAVSGPSGTQESDPSNQSKMLATSVEPFSADLAMSLVLDDVDPVTVGEIVSYTFFATNNGPDDVNVASVRLLLDGDVEIVSVPSAADIACDPPNTSSGLADVAILCTVFPLEYTNPRGFTFQVRPLSGTSVVATARIFTAPLTTVDPNTGTEENSQTTTVAPDNGVDFEIASLDVSEVTDGSAPVQPGDVLRYTGRMDLNSAYTSPISNAVYRLSVAGNVTVESAPAGCSTSDFPVGSGKVVECDAGDYVIGEIKTFAIDIATTRIETIEATATAVPPGGTTETDASNQSLLRSTDVEPFSADLAMSLVLDDVDPVTVGDIVTYTFDATNNGPDDVNVASVRLLLDGDVEIVSVPSAADIACDPPNLSGALADVAILCTVFPLRVVNPRRFTFEVRPLSGTSVVATARIFPAPLTTVDPNVGNEENDQTTTVEPGAPTLSGDLMYTTDLNGTQGRIFIESLPSGSPSMLGVIAFAVDPVWSPDRSKVAYVRGSLYVVDADGNNNTELVDLIPYQLIGAPEWLDDDRIVFHMSDERDVPTPDLDLYVYTLSTSTLTQLTDNDVDDRDPDASSGQIVYVRGDSEMRTMSYDGTGDATLYTDAGVVRHPQWSGDLSQIVFARDNDGTDDDLDILDVVPLTTSTVHSSTLIDKPVWSPDGQFIAFVKDNGFEFGIFYVPSGGGGATALVADPDWSFLDPDWR